MVQSQSCSGVPAAVLAPVASRHRRDFGLTSVPLLVAHIWLPLPLQSDNCAAVPLAVPPPATSRHLPIAWIVPSPGVVHCCAAVPLHVHNWTGVPLALLPPRTSTHMPAGSEREPGGGGTGSEVTTSTRTPTRAPF